MKKWGIVLLTSITAAVLGAAMCMAEERIPAEEPLAPNYTPYIEIPDVTASDSISIVCDQEPVLGQEGIWSIATPFDTYAFSLCENTGEEYVSPVYLVRNTPENVFSYTIHEPGNYVLIYSGILNNEIAAQDYYFFTIDPMDGVETVSSKVNEIAEECLQAVDGGDYEKALWLHDWIVYHAHYDNGYNHYGPDGILFYEKGVCDSYSKLYERLLNKVGIQNCRVLSEDHAWNAACLEGEWCHIDTTWDDPNNGETEVVSGDEYYDYFGLNDACILKADSHDFDPEDYDFQCTSLQNSYVYRNGIYRTWLYFAMDSISESLEEGILSFEAPVLEGRIGAMLDEDGNCTSFYPAGEYADQRLDWGAQYLSMDTHLLMGQVQVQGIFSYNAEEQKIEARIDLSPYMMTLPEDILIVGEEAFASAESMVALQIPEGAHAIGDRAFMGCSSLIELVIPQSVTEMSASSLEGLPSFTTIVCEHGSAAEIIAEELGFRMMEPEE